MTLDDIIRMAQEAGMRESGNGDWTAADAALTYPECVYTENLERFANLVAAAEREAICALLDRLVDTYENRDRQGSAEDIRKLIQHIHARGQ